MSYMKRKNKDGLVMNLKIISDFGENNFVMTVESAINVINDAMKYDEREHEKEVAKENFEKLHNISEDNENARRDLSWADKPIVLRAGNTRNESLFGENWKDSIPKKTTEEKQLDFARSEEGYRGFLYIKCPKCGKTKGFCAKNNTKDHYCSCGERIGLKELKPMYASCECGKDFRYFTNMDKETFDLKCINCGRDINISLNSRSTAYVTKKKTKMLYSSVDKYGRTIM